MVAVAAMFQTGCGSSGSPAPAPGNVNVVAGDTNVTVSWDAQPGVEYWVYKAIGSNITPQNCISMQECKTLMGVSSPMVFPGLTNGTTYSFTINGRTGGGKGGPGTSSISATPRLAGGLAGTAWSAGTPLSSGSPLATQNLRGVAYGSVFIAAGDNGALFSSSDGISWTALTHPLPTANLYAASYYGGKYLVVGAGGLILLSTDAITWTQQTSGTTNNLYAISNFGVGGFVATGANGTILTSSDGVSWATRTSNTTNALYGITYGNGRYVAVGAASTTGTLLTSVDGGITWQAVALLPVSDLKGVAYGAPQLAYDSTYTSQNLPAARFVAVGANGTVVKSLDGGATWTSQTLASPTQLNTITFGHQFIAADNVGNLFSSTDGSVWPLAQSSVTPLYAVAPAQYVSGQYGGRYVYSVVGASGVNMLAK